MLSLALMMAQCLLLTIIIESAAAFICGVRKRDGFIAVALANVITNPVVASLTYFIGYYYGAKVRMPVEFLLEAAVIPIEGFIYSSLSVRGKRGPYLLSLILNLCSYLSGYLISFIIGGLR